MCLHDYEFYTALQVIILIKKIADSVDYTNIHLHLELNYCHLGFTISESESETRYE